MSNKSLFIIVILLGSIIYSAKSQLTLEIQPLPDAQTVDVSEMPRFKSFLRAEYSGNPIPLRANNIIVIENNTNTTPISVTPFANNWYEVVWHTLPKGYLQGNNIVEFIVSYNNSSSRVFGTFGSIDYPKVLIRNQQGATIEELHFGTLPAGARTLRQVRVTALKGRMSADSLEKPIRIDSVKLGTPYYTYRWQGSEFDRTPPPVAASIGSGSLVDIYFQPVTDEFYSDYFTVYYENGFKERIYLTANKFEIEHTTVLQLLQPVGGEILSPCEIYPVRWKGSVPGLPTKVFYSTNNGATWTLAGESKDSVFYWQVPKIFTQSGKIKVKQDFTSTKRISLRDDTKPIKKVTYSPNSSKLLSAGSEGKIVEWNTLTNALTTRFFFNSTTSSQITYDIFGIAYIEGDSIFAAAYNLTNASTNIPDTIAYFKSGSAFPFAKIPVEKGFKTKEMFIDSKRSIITLIPQLGTEIIILNAKDAVQINKISFPYPVQAMSFSTTSDKAAIYMLNGEVRIMNLPDFTAIETIDLSFLPIVLELSLSPNGNLLALGCKAPIPTPTSIANNEIHVLDLKLKKIVRTVRNTASDPVGLEFNPSSTILVIGSKAQPQIAFWDLITGDYIGSLGGTINSLNDFSFSPDGHSVAVSSVGIDNLLIQSFTYPEETVSPEPFEIIEPIVELGKATIDTAYIGESIVYQISAAVCNVGISNITFNRLNMRFGTNFNIISFEQPVHIVPGECFDIEYIYHPLDTGIIRDTIIIYSDCMGEYLIPVEKYSKNRNLRLLSDILSFGEQCIGGSLDRNFNLFSNQDPVPVEINSIEFIIDGFRPFSIIFPLTDTLLLPEQILSIAFRFRPIETQNYNGKIRIYHSDQRKHFIELPISGKGIGTNLTLSHNQLLFIPEITQRKIIIKNNADNLVTITNADIQPQGEYYVLTNLPLQINSFGTAELEILWNGSGNSNYVLSLKVEPCITYYSVQLGQYIGTSILSIPTVEADPRGEAIIPINFLNTENGKYAGERFLMGEISLNPRLFMPLEIKSDFGKADITKNYVKDELRHIEFKVTGDFPLQGTAAEIHGVAGIAETDSSQINFINLPEYWGKAVSSEFRSGLLKIVGICNDRFILHNDGTVNLINITPNPADGKIDIEFNSTNAGQASLQIFNTLGLMVFRSEISINTGYNRLDINVADLPIGNYRLLIRTANAFDNANIIIIR